MPCVSVRGWAFSRNLSFSLKTLAVPPPGVYLTLLRESTFGFAPTLDWDLFSSDFFPGGFGSGVLFLAGVPPDGLLSFFDRKHCTLA